MRRIGHLERAKMLLDRGDKSYREARAEILAALEDDGSLTMAAIGKQLGRSGSWVKQLIEWDPQRTETPYGGPDVAANRDGQKARAAMRDAERRRSVLRSLTDDELAGVAGDASAVHRERTAALRAEHGLPEHERKANLAGFRDDDEVVRALAPMLNPALGIGEARRAFAAVIDAGATLPDETWLEVLEELRALSLDAWTYGATRGLDVGELAAAAGRTER
jgi:hypothetical protein